MKGKSRIFTPPQQKSYFLGGEIQVGTPNITDI